VPSPKKTPSVLPPGGWAMGEAASTAGTAVLMNASAVLMNASNECRGVPPARNVFDKVQKIKDRRFLCVFLCGTKSI
jgi:hypothetical protein